VPERIHEEETGVVPRRTCCQALFQLASTMTSQFGYQLFVKVNGSPTSIRLRSSLNNGIAHLHTDSNDLSAPGLRDPRLASEGRATPRDAAHE